MRSRPSACVCMTSTVRVMIQYLGLYDVNRLTREEVMLYAGLYDVDRHCHDTTRGVIWGQQTDTGERHDAGLYDANRQKVEVTTQQTDGPPEPSVVSPVPACSRGYHSATGSISQKQTHGHELLWLPPSRSRTSYLTPFAKMIMMPSILMMTMT